MTMMRKIRKKQGGFSLIEMLVVIIILAALVTQILPSVNVTEREVNTIADDYNNAATLRYLSMFNALTGTYPSGLHTGLQDNANAPAPSPDNDSWLPMPNISVDVAMMMLNEVDNTNCDSANDNWQLRDPNEKNPIIGNVALINDRPVKNELTYGEMISLKKAGITTLGYGENATKAIDVSTATSFGEALGAADLVASFVFQDIAAGNVPLSRNYMWDSTNSRVFPSAGALAASNVLLETVTVRGLDAESWAGNLYTGSNLDGVAATDAAPDVSFLITFVYNTVDWTTYYDDYRANDDDGNNTIDAADDVYGYEDSSRIEVVAPARSPWMANDTWSYYVAIFGVDNPDPSGGNVTVTSENIDSINKAELIAVLSPSNLKTLTP